MARTAKQPTTVRSLTVSVQTVKNTWSESHFPKCTLVSAWLRAAGFEIGDRITVQVEQEKLTVLKR